MDRQIVRDSLIRGASRQMNVCEKLRVIYDSVYQLPEGELKQAITEGLIDAMEMAKKMNMRFDYYVKTYHDTTGHQGRHLKAIDQEAIAKMRKGRP